MPSRTVEHLIDGEHDFRLEIFSLCMDKSCEMAYFSADYGYLFLQRDVEVPIDFKEASDIKYACYCHEITIDDLRLAVKKDFAKSAKDILNRSKPVIVENCKKHNPFGCSCLADMNKMIEEIRMGLSGDL